MLIIGQLIIPHWTKSLLPHLANEQYKVHGQNVLLLAMQLSLYTAISWLPTFVQTDFAAMCACVCACVRACVYACMWAWQSLLYILILSLVYSSTKTHTNKSPLAYASGNKQFIRRKIATIIIIGAASVFRWVTFWFKKMVVPYNLFVILVFNFLNLSFFG